MAVRAAAPVSWNPSNRDDTINAAGDTYIGDDKVEADTLQAQLAALAQVYPTRIVYVRGDRTIEYGRLMDLLDLVNHAGFAKVSLLAEAAKPQK